jgi:hypothetical protein
MDSRAAKVNIDMPESDPAFLKEQKNPVVFVLRRNSTRAAREGGWRESVLCPWTLHVRLPVSLFLGSLDYVSAPSLLLRCKGWRDCT